MYVRVPRLGVFPHNLAFQVAGQNVQKLLQRGETIDALEVKAADLEMGAGRFERASAKLRSDMCWRDCRWKLLALIVLVLMIIFITLLAVLIRKHHA